MALSKNAKMEREILEVQKVLETYRNDSQHQEHLYIGLFGRSGCGKTSLINSLMCTVSGPIRQANLLPVGNIEKAGGHTLVRVIASLKGNISVIDNRGVDDLSKTGVLEELKAQIDGTRGLTKMVEWEKPQGDAYKVYIIDVEKGEYPIGCAVFVFSAQDSISRSTTGLFKAVHFLQAQQGRYPVAVITHVDVVAERQSVETLISALKVTGISEIFEVANITKKKEELETSYQHTLLSLLDRCMADGDANAVVKHHRQKEHNEEQRKKQEQERKKKLMMEKEKRKKVEKEKEAERIRKQKLQEAKNIKIAVGVGAGAVGTATGTAALIGMAVAGPVGAAVGAGIGVIGGTASLLTGMALGDR